MRIALIVLLSLVALAGVVVALLASGTLGHLETAGVVTPVSAPSEVIAARAAEQRGEAMRQGVANPKQILFGDLHVHTTFSFDAFITSLPIIGGEGTRPPADACDFARHCSALDFWSINDHAEGLTPDQWKQTVESIRQCNDVAGDANNPDSVAFLGWEWSQIDYLPETHYGHKNVVFRSTDDDRIPARPIGARSSFTRGARATPLAVRLYVGGVGGQRGRDFIKLMLESQATPDCPTGVPVRELPSDCRESVETPAELFAKLDDWGHDSIVIPHGNAWGLYTPAGSTWDKQLADHDPERETMIEIYSGHGNSEEYRDFRAVTLNADGSRSCPEASDDYTPSCWRAGEIIAARCLEEAAPGVDCDERAAEARQHNVDGLLGGHRAISGTTATDWLDSGQCTDCFQPAFNYRPGNSAQYMLAVRQFDERGDPIRFRMAFMASSDGHTARPGTGYKEVARGRMTDGRGRKDGARPVLRPFGEEEPSSRSQAFDPHEVGGGLGLFDFERAGSFFVTGGLIAVHAQGRDRDAVWQALDKREIYATSGPRILLWFDLLNQKLPMGSSAVLSETPYFRVRAAGSLEQRAGCPDYVTEVLGEERVASLCAGECYNPSDTRRAIDRIEIVRVRPQNHADEPIASLIDDPWRVFQCPAGREGCTVTFHDPDFADAGRDAVYYARAIEEAKPTINGDNVRCETDEAGRCIATNPCGAATPYADDCLADSEPRAWSSPIWIDYGIDSGVDHAN